MGLHAHARAWLGQFVPEGRPLPAPQWAARHRAIIAVVLAHAVALPLFGLARAQGVLVSFAAGAVLLALGLVAYWPRAARPFREGVAALALVTASSIVVQFSGGTIEAHFHFFVVLALIALYQSWLPFLLAIAFVALDHGLVGTIAPEWVYNHPDAFAHPWRWAFIHAAFVLAESAALMAAWKLTEDATTRTDIVLESAGEGILGTDEKGEILFANPAAAQLAGKRVEELIGLPIDTLLPGTNGGTHAETTLHGEGGQPPIPVEYDRNPMMRNGMTVGTVVTLKDIRDRKRAQSVLSETVSTLTATLESTADGILVIDRDGRIRLHNQRFLDIWHVPPEVMAQGDDDLALRSVLGQLVDPDEFVRRVRELYARPSEESFETLRFKDGRYVERYSRPHRLPDGEIVGRVWSFRDVTERKQAEAAALAARVSRPMARKIVQAVLTEKRADVATLMRLGQDIAGQMEADDLKKALGAYASMGLGALTHTHSGTQRYEFEGDDLFERAPEQQASTTCHLALGFLCGTVQRVTGELARGAEVACQSRGDETCRFVISTRPGP